MQRFNYCLSVLTIFMGLIHSSMAQNSLTGTITSADGLTLAGATIQVKETQLVTSSDIEGNYSINGLKSGEYKIEFSFIGYYDTTYSVSFTGNEQTLNVVLQPQAYLANELIVEATRAGSKTPVAQTTVTKEELDQNKSGQDVPYLLRYTPSVVSTSDAGSGIGYTGMRIRGSDATRVNVTINGIPYNDAESQSTYWVNINDLAASTNDIQIQRGVGTSTNGSGAFGGSVNLSTNQLNKDAYAQYGFNYGSFNTIKNTLNFGTGLMGDKFTIDGRASKLTSDGYIDRASADLSSYYLNASYWGKKSSVKFITFSGKERTYQAWNGSPKSYAEDPELRTFNPYDYPDQVDDYYQDHYQLHYLQQVNDKINFTAALHYTKGGGFFEEYKGDEYNLTIGGSKEDLADYGLPPVVVGDDTVYQTNLVRRRWLDNDFYGGIWSLDYTTTNLKLIWGGGVHIYDGDHFGEVIWAEYASTSMPQDRYYENYGKKDDFNTYLKANYDWNKLSAFADLQIRQVNYNAWGVYDDLSDIDIDVNYTFFNPKAGLNYQINSQQRAYASFAVGNREPVRGDFLDADPGVTPQPESMIDYELGYEISKSRWALMLNGYYMDYTDQLVLTGAINQDGEAVRENISESYRMGLELQMGVQIAPSLEWTWNATFSQNKIAEYTEKVDDWYNGGQVETVLNDVDISFSPSVIASSGLTFDYSQLVFGSGESNRGSITWLAKYVGDQYIDNTQRESSKLDAYFTNDIQFNYTVLNSNKAIIQFNAVFNNVLNNLYINNGWIYRFIYPSDDWDPSADDIYTEKSMDANAPAGSYYMGGYFPQAEFNFSAGVNVKF